MNQMATDALGEKVDVGTHGYVQLVDVMGDDDRVVDAARISYGRHGERDEAGDRRLLRYMMRHHHTTPFEQCEMVFIVKVPMDTWRQWIRHRTASVNEYSTRYTAAIDDTAVTAPDAWRLQSQANRQGSDQGVASNVGERLSQEEVAFQQRARWIYKSRLDAGVAREQARKDLPLSTYTLAFWKIDVHNLMHFLGLRLDSHAQEEIREYANVVLYFFHLAFPTISDAFHDYRTAAVTFSRTELLALRGLVLTPNWSLARDEVREYGLEGREADEFLAKLEAIRG
ncbi:hypothetical protein LCGC14_0252550 [marine sediment metagenome]|uniref:Uncharacterized protein n=1 Tax=marine sediment metagenome TaxID=412755 RepID=A0A0F9X986_9ZZZZ